MVFRLVKALLAALVLSAVLVGISPMIGQAQATPELSIVKTHDPDPAIIGEELTYSLQVTNSGAAATPVTVTDYLPDNVTYVSGTVAAGSTGTCAEAGGIVTCVVDSMASGAAVDIDIVVVVDDVTGSQTVPLPADPTAAVASGSTSGPVARTGTWAGNTSTAGQITINAAASDFTGPAGFSSTPTGAMGIHDAYTDVYGLGSIPTSPSFQFVFSWDTAPEGGTTAADTDVGSAVLTYTFSEPVTDPVLHIDRLGGTAAQNGVGATNSALLTLLDGLTLSELSGTDGFTTTATTIERSEVPIASGDTTGAECAPLGNAGTACGTIQIQGTVSTVRFLMEAAPGTVEGAGGDGIEMVWDVQPQADMAVTKTADDIIHFGGDTYSYTVTATNNGPNTNFDVAVVESLPAGTTLISSTPSTGTFNGTTWTIGTMAAGASATLTLVMEIPAGTAETMLDNTVTISGRNTDPDLSDNTANAPVYTCPTGTFPNLAGASAGAGSTESDITDNYDQSCTTVGASIVFAKVSNGGIDTFDFSGTNLDVATDSVTTTVAGTPVESGRHAVTDLGTDVTLTETLPAGWNAASISCVDANAALSGNGSGTLASSTGSESVTVPASVLVPGAEIVCTFVNDKQATLTTVKNGVGGSDPFDFTLDGSTSGSLAAFTLTPPRPTRSWRPTSPSTRPSPSMSSGSTLRPTP